MRRKCLSENVSKVPSGSKAEIPNHNPKKVDDDKNKSLRIQGIPEDFDKPAKENILLTNEKLKDVFNTLGVTSQIFNVKRLGKFDSSRSKLRTIMVEVSNEWEKRTILAKSIEKRTELMNKNIYILPALSREEAFKENACLEKRRELREILNSSKMISKLKLLLPPSDYVQGTY